MPIGEKNFKPIREWQKYCSGECRMTASKNRYLNTHREQRRKYIANYILTRYHNDPEFRKRIIENTRKCEVKREAKRKKAGLCVDCGAPSKPYFRCEKCREKARMRYYKQKTNREIK